MKQEITQNEFLSKVRAIADEFGADKFKPHEFDEKAGYITGYAPFDVFVSLGRDGRLYFDARLYVVTPEGKTLWASDYTEWNHRLMGRETINNKCSSDFSRSADSIAKQVRRLIDAVMPHWHRLMQAYNDTVDTNRRTRATLETIKSLIGDLIVDKNLCGDGFYVKGMNGHISAYADKVQISSLHTLSLSPERAAKLIRLLAEEGE